ncbi:FYVE zinc finger-domain-containing protein [Cercophora newfieldiana]|uniref:RING-type E3 ubiquitin transferase n=1 Tax=Cercophora newfieldiana TaxID=92897 RepID=A0AA39YRJ1_9PEZI|nr:FYVE zinc finger-domain-containing protein [Cercophora newfieldiana]
MSSPRDGGGPVAVSASTSTAPNPPAGPDNGSDADDSSSESSYAGSGASEPRDEHVCRYRTDRFHDRECSRYFDCPTHLVDRVLSDGEDDRDVELEEYSGNRDVIMSDTAEEEEDDNDAEEEPREAEGSGGAPVAEGEVARPATPPARSTTADNPIVLDDDSSPEAPQPARRPAPVQGAGGDRTEERTSQDYIGAHTQHGAANPEDPVPPTFDQQPDLIRLEAERNRRRLQLARRQSLAAQGQQPPSASQTHLPVPPRPSATIGPGGPPEVALPRWQPDAEVTYCPICRTQFSFFIRKHHCRKCGRVVCNDCSPHHIILPFEYIVRPPWDQRPRNPRYSSGFLSGDGQSPDFSGGERVRLCNPCVPDPNTAPPQTPGGHSRSQSGLSQNPQSTGAQVSDRWSSYFGGSNPVSDAHVRSRSVTMQSGVVPTAGRHAPGTHRQRPIEDRILSGTPPVYYQPGSSPAPNLPPGYASRTRAAGGPSSAYDRSLPLPPLPPPPPARDSQRRPSASTSQARQQQYQIAEEDECPVCHRELPSRTLPNFEALRESHITTCITAHSSYNGTATTGPSTGGEAPLPRVPPRRTGMFPYIATEKDCVDSAECTICLEEFEVGVGMARLECLCRFHRDCIRAWFERHPGRCPMHQHEDFGY